MKRIDSIFLKGFSITLIVFILILPLISSFYFKDISLLNLDKAPKEELEDSFVKFNEVQQTNSEKVNNLLQQWKELALKNEFLKELDNSFKEINLFFFILFGEDYSFSLYFLLIFILWLFLLLNFYYIIRSYSTFSEFASAFISFSITLISAHLGLFKTISKFLISLIFNLNTIIQLSIIFGIIIILFYFIFFFKKNFKEIKEEREKRQEKQDREILHKEAEMINDTNKELSKYIK
jgi:hypothetical protein